MEETNLQRRRWLSLGGIMLGATLLSNKASAIVSTPKPMMLRLRNVNTGDVVAAQAVAGGFNSASLQKLNYLMRDRRENKVRAIDPKLYLKLMQVQSRLGMRNSEILVLSGYRTPRSNRAVRGASNSYHVQGKAVDFYIQGVSLSRIRNAAESLHNGGVGYYPRSNFVHVDTGPVRSWRG